MVKTIVLGMSFYLSSMAAVLAAVVAAGGTSSRSQTTEPAVSKTVPACTVETDVGYFPSYIDDAFPQLKAAVPALHGLKVEDESAAGESEKIVRETGAAIEGMLPKVPNLIAKEEVSQASLPLPYMVSAGNQTTGGYGQRGSGRSLPPVTNSTALRAADSTEVRDAIQSMLKVPKNQIPFSYRIQSDPDAEPGMKLREFRMNAQNETILKPSTKPGDPQGVGFGSSWLMFDPANLRDLRFRYLGREKVGKYDTVVLAFAQIPERVIIAPRITINGYSCYYFMQGVAWIDPATSQLVRLQTDLQGRLMEFHEKKLRSEIDFSEVRIPSRNLTLWMPNRVEISWEMDNQAGAELHRYSDWKLFGSTSRILIPDPE